MDKDMTKDEMSELISQNIIDIVSGNVSYNDADELNDLAQQCEERMEEMGFAKKNFNSPLERLSALHHALSSS